MTFGAPPVLLRVAGFPAEVMEPFASLRCVRQIELLLQLERELDAARAEMEDRLFEKVHGAPDEVRGVLLSVKRDCHNGRSLAKWKPDRFRSVLDAAAPGMLDRVLGLEERVAAWRDQFRGIFHEERDRERGALLAIVEDADFRRGLALAAPTLVRNLDRLRKTSYGRKERGMDQSLLRYVSRTAFKLSPFSTFTRVGLGLLSDDVRSGPIQLTQGGWRPRSLSRIKKLVPAQYCTMLLHEGSFRARLEIRPNHTAELVEDGKYRFVRPGRWIFKEESTKLVFQLESLVNVRLGGELIEEVQRHLARGRFTHEDLIESVAAAVGCPVEDARSTVDKLIEIGFLLLQLPWLGTETDVDQSFLAFLRDLPESDLLLSFRRVYERLEHLKKAYPSSESPEDVVAEIDGAVDEGFQILGQGLFGSSVDARSDEARNLNEDVLLLSGAGSRHQELARVDARSAKQAVASVQPLLRFANLFSHRHDFLYSMRSFIAERWPGCREVGVLDVFEQMQDLWLDYRRFVNRTYSSAEKLSWNPFDLAAIVSLHGLRERIWTEMKDLIHEGADEFHISPEGLEELMSGVSRDYAPMVGPCLFLQPVDRRGDLWVSNRILEGTGRFGSRYTGAMEADMRRRYSDHAVRCSSFDLQGEPVEILDLAGVSGNYLNVHAIQTPRVLDLLGEPSGLEEARRIRLKDLRVRVGGGGFPVLVDPSGRRLLPTHLGMMSMRLLPSLTRFLAHFGPGEFGYPIPSLPPLEQGEVKVYRRVRLGNVIIRRRRWITPTEPLRALLQHADDHEVFERVNRWRLTHGIPEHVFLSERLPAKFFEQEVYKPQYLSFTSPLFLNVLSSALKGGQERLAIEEMLPTPEMFPVDGQGRGWAVELQLDSLFLGPGRSRPARPQPGSRRAPAVARPSSTSEEDDVDLSPAMGLAT